MVQRFIHTCDSRALGPRYGFVDEWSYAANFGDSFSGEKSCSSWPLVLIVVGRQIRGQRTTVLPQPNNDQVDRKSSCD